MKSRLIKAAPTIIATEPIAASGTLPYRSHAFPHSQVVYVFGWDAKSLLAALQPAVAIAR
jgi:hypothetical protein